MMGVCCRQPVQANISGEKFQYNPLPFRQKTAEHPSGYFFAPVGFDTMAAAQARRVSALTCVLVCIFAAVGGVREQAAGVSGQDGRHHQVGAQGDQVLQTRRSERRKVHSEGACVIMDEVAPTDMVLHMNRPPPPLFRHHPFQTFSRFFSLPGQGCLFLALPKLVIFTCALVQGALPTFALIFGFPGSFETTTTALLGH